MGLRAGLVLCAVLVSASAPPAGDTFRFLQPAIRFSDEDWHTLDDGEVVVKILPANGQELAAMAAASIEAGPDALVRSINNIVELKRSRLVPQLGRFSPQPRIEDLNALTIDDADVADIRHCEPGHCGLQLEPDEISRLQQAVAAVDQGADAGSNRTAKDQATQEFRRILLARTQDYLRHGDERTAAQFSTLLQHSPYLRARVPQLVEYLERYPAARVPGAQSFMCWSKGMYAWKPMITLTHFTILRGDGVDGSPEVLVTARDIFSTRYISGSLALTMLFRAQESAGSRHYLVYINRTWVDGVHALWRPIVEHRIRKQAQSIFADIRARIERHEMRAS